MKNQATIAKSLAKQLGAALAASGQEMAHSNLLEVVAKAYGARTWHAFLSEQTQEPQVSPATVSPWTPTQGPMSQAQYMQRCSRGRSVCPACGSPDVDWDEHPGEASSSTESAQCNLCAATWMVDYAVCGYHDLAPAVKPLSATSTLEDVEQWLRDCEVDDSQLDGEVGNAVAKMDPDTSESEEEMLTRLEWEIAYINNGGLRAQLECLFKSFNGDMLKFVDYLKKLNGLEHYSPMK